MIESLCLFLSPSGFQVVQSHIARNCLRLSCTVICDGDLNLWMLIWCYIIEIQVGREKTEKGTTSPCKSTNITNILNTSMSTDSFLHIWPCHHAVWYEPTIHPTSSLSCHCHFSRVVAVRHHVSLHLSMVLMSWPGLYQVVGIRMAQLPRPPLKGVMSGSGSGDVYFLLVYLRSDVKI